MNPTGIFFFITFAILFSVTVAELTDKDIKELQKGIRDYIKPDEERKSNETLDNRIKKYVDAVKEARHKNITANPVVTELLEFSRKHRYYKDYVQNSNCTDKIKINECKNRRLDKKVNETMYGFHSPANKSTPNLVKLVADPDKNIKYTKASCNKGKALRHCIAKEAINNCDNNTRTFILDIQDYLYEQCLNKTDYKNEPERLIMTNSVVVGCVMGGMLFLILVGSIIACLKCRNSGTHTVA